MEKIFWITLHLCILLVCSSDIKPVMVEKTKTDFVGKEKRVLLENPAFNESPVLIEADKKEEDYPAWNENQPLSKQWRGGSAEKARTKVKQLDRFQEQMKEDKESYIKNQKKRRFALGPKKNDLAEPQRTDSNSMTKTMKANKPGTEEFKTRQKALDEVVNKVTKKKKEKKRNTNLEVAQNEDKNKIELLPYYKDARVSKTLSLQRFKKLTPEESLISDISKTIHFSFANLFFRKADKLRPAELIAFRDFLNLLQVSLPPEWRLHRLIGDLRRNFVKVGKGRENLQDILKKYPQPNLAWSNDCKTGGFHCGFWKLLHTITVGIAEHRGGLNLIEVDLIEPNAKTFAPMEAADVIRSYINHFYIDCDNCRKTFMELYSDCENNRRCDRLTDDKDGASIADWKELALWYVNLFDSRSFCKCKSYICYTTFFLGCGKFIMRSLLKLFEGTIK